jgi:hypothetical protein
MATTLEIAKALQCFFNWDELLINAGFIKILTNFGPKIAKNQN